MKKIFLYVIAGSLCFSACKKDDDDTTTYVEPESITAQNTYDDQAIKTFLQNNYLDSQGNIMAFSSTDTSDDNETKLADLNPVTLPSGVVYIKRDGAQPTPAEEKTIGTTDVIKMMVSSRYLVADASGFIAGYDFINTISGGGSPIKDPLFYYVKNSILNSATKAEAKERKYYEMEGFQEGLKYFKAYNNKPNSDNYNLQGVIIVPSRAAFARDNNYYNDQGYTFRNATFVFNFQIYNTETRTDAQD